ncbi:MAG: MlaD family protein [Bacteroidia bacterium]
MAIKLSNEVKFGILSLITLVIFVYGMNFLKGSKVFGSDMELYANYADVKGLQRGSQVQINGLQIGRVEEIIMDPKTMQMRVILKFDKIEEIKLPSDSKAVIVSAGLMGGMNVKIVPGRAATFFKTKQEIQTADELGLMDKAGPFVDKINGQIDSVKIKNILSDVNGITSHVNELTAALQNSLGVSNGNSETLSLGREEIMAMIKNVRAISDQLNTTSKELDKITGTTNGALGKVDGIVVDAKGVVKNVDGVVLDAKSSVASVNQSLASVNRIINGNTYRIDSTMESVRYISNRSETLPDSVKLVMADLRVTLNNVDVTIDELKKVLEGVQKGDGTLGALVKDKEMYNNLNHTLDSLQGLISHYKKNPFQVRFWGKTKK